MDKTNIKHSHDHHHEDGFHHHHHQAGGESIKTAFFLNLAFTIIEIAGGLFTNSMAILSDALHDFGDCISLGIAWYLEKYSKKGPDYKYSYGYSRFSVLGALITSMVLIAGAVIIFMNAIPRILSPQGVYPEGMLLLSILGILINGIAFLKLRKSNTFNEKMAAWHVLEDVLGWMVVLLVSIILMFKDWFILDPILSLVITLYVLFNVVRNLRKIFRVLLQGVPKDMSLMEITEELEEIEGVKEAYHAHLWSLDGVHNLLSVHLLLADDISSCEMMRIKEEAALKMEGRSIDHLTVQIDFPEEKRQNSKCY